MFRPPNLGAGVAEQIALAREITSKAWELLMQPPPDTFLGRKQHEPMPPPHEDEE